MGRTYNRELVHGTVMGYLYRGCRCEECRQALRDYKGNRPRAVYDAEREPRHGTESRYIHRGCRCDECVAAANAARAQRRLIPNVQTHNRNGYSNGCRCDICREAQLVYNNARKHERRQ